MADVAAAELQKMTIQTSKPTLVPKRAPGQAGRALEINTNITQLAVAKNLAYFKYDIRVNAVFVKKDGSEGVKEFAKQTRDDYNEQERKKACIEIFTHLVKSEKTFSGDLIYDRAAIMFATKKLDGVGAEGKTFTLPGKAQTVCPDAARIEVILKPAADTFQVTSNDLASVVNADFKGESKGLMEVLNLATSQVPFFSPNDFITYGNGNIYLLDPAAHGFSAADAPTIGNDKYIGIGLSKGVKVLEGNSKPGNKDYMPALVLDVKKTAFHYDNQPLADKIVAMYGNHLPSINVLTRELKDVRCICTHKKASIVIGSFTTGPIGKATFKDKEGKVKSVANYYQEKYGKKIVRMDLPGVVDKYMKNIYPADFLKIAPNQRVKATQANKEVVEQLIKVAAIKPEIRFRQTQALSNVLGLNSKNVKALGISASPNTLQIPARQLNAVTLQGGQGQMSGPAWRGTPKVVVGAKVDKWAAFVFYRKGGRIDGPGAFRAFLGEFVKYGTAKGMQMAQPMIREELEVLGNVEPMISSAVRKAAQAGCTYVLIVSEDREKTHDQLKHEELVNNLTTQEIKLSRAAQVGFERKMQTLENIIMKTNAKLRGMNHVVANDKGIMHSPDTMICGIFVQQPRSMSSKEIEGGAQPSMPAVIGFSANNGNMQAAAPPQREAAAQQYFTSAWKYANPREWTTGETQRVTMKNMMIDGLKQFKANRGRIPQKVIIYRGGVSEGQLPYIASTERDTFIEAFKSLNQSYNPTLVIIACSKEHNERFYLKEFPKAAPGQRVDTNVAPGVVVDKVAVNPEMNEFYLQAHKALQGTAKATKYTLLHESSGALSNDAIQHMTNCLCHLHEIVNSTTAIPTPLYVAEESSKRAVNIYHHVKGAYESYNLDELNTQLASKSLGSRINA